MAGTDGGPRDSSDSESASVFRAPRWVPVAAAVLAGGVLVWQRARLMPDFSVTSLAAVVIVAMVVYGTAYALLSLASRARGR